MKCKKKYRGVFLKIPHRILKFSKIQGGIFENTGGYFQIFKNPSKSYSTMFLTVFEIQKYPPVFSKHKNTGGYFCEMSSKIQGCIFKNTGGYF